MRVDWLSLTGFRSYKQVDWRPDRGVNLLVGPNGAGKTNVLEAVSYLSTLKSFRGASDSALVADDSDSAVIRSGLTGKERERLIEMEIPRSGAKRVQVDKNKLKRSADLLGVIRTVAFLPDDLDLVKRGPALRRELLDDIAIQLWPAANLDQSEFERALRQRNAFLKSGDRDGATLGVWDSRLAQAGGKVLARRARVIEVLTPLLAAAYTQIAGPGPITTITYVNSWDGTALAPMSAADYAIRVDEGLERARRIDYERRMTTVGPHRDEPGFALDDADSRNHASQGEQRSIALAIKLAAHQAILEVVGDSPVLLLDDVFSELDPERSEALAKTLPADTQTLITSARPEELPVVGRLWRVEGGRVL